MFFHFKGKSNCKLNDVWKRFFEHIRLFIWSSTKDQVCFTEKTPAEKSVDVTSYLIHFSMRRNPLPRSERTSISASRVDLGVEAYPVVTGAGGGRRLARGAGGALRRNWKNRMFPLMIVAHCTGYVTGAAITHKFQSRVAKFVKDIRIVLVIYWHDLPPEQKFLFTFITFWCKWVTLTNHKKQVGNTDYP